MSELCGIRSDGGCNDPAEWEVEQPDLPYGVKAYVCGSHVVWVLDWNGIPNLVTALVDPLEEE